MEWVKSLLNYLASGVNIHHPINLLIILILGAFSEVGVPLFFSLEILLFFISYTYGPLTYPALLVILMLLLGREVGSNFLYLVARGLGGRFLDWLGKRSSRTAKAVEQFKGRLNKNPALVVAMVRITPGLLQVPSISAGAVRLRQLSFVEGVALSSVIYDSIPVLLGFGGRFLLPHINTQPETFLFIGFGFLIILVWLILFLFYRHNGAKYRKTK
jgi:membrane protein DedA with SNARE-associated domain